MFSDCIQKELKIFIIKDLQEMTFLEYKAKKRT